VLKFILNILCDVIHDVFIKHVYDTVRKKTVDFLCTHAPTFIEPENWPLNSPAFNPVDYSIWDALQQLVYWQQVRDIEHLKDVLVTSWEQISQASIDRAVGQFQKRLASIIAAKGGRPSWTFFWLAVWLLLTCYISFAYVCDVML